MKTTTLLFLFICTFSNSAISQVTFDNGETYYVDSSETILCNGKFRKFYPGFKIKSSTNYSKGKLNGESIEYFENGQTKSIINYSNGIINGEATEFYPETLVIKSKFTFLNGMKNGEFITYKENGEVLEKRVYVNDVLQE